MQYHLCSLRATDNKNLEKNNKIILKIKFWKSHLHTSYNVYFFYKLRIKSTSFSSPQFLLCYHTMKIFFSSSPVDADFYCPLVMIQMFPKDLHFFDI